MDVTPGRLSGDNLPGVRVVRQVLAALGLLSWLVDTLLGSFDPAVKSWEVVYLPSAETVRLTPGQGPSRA